MNINILKIYFIIFEDLNKTPILRGKDSFEEKLCEDDTYNTVDFKIMFVCFCKRVFY